MHVAEHFIDVARAERPDIFRRRRAVHRQRAHRRAVVRAPRPERADSRGGASDQRDRAGAPLPPLRRGARRRRGDARRARARPRVARAAHAAGAVHRLHARQRDAGAAPDGRALVGAARADADDARRRRHRARLRPVCAKARSTLVRDKRLYAALDAAEGLVGVRRRFLDLRRYMSRARRLRRGLRAPHRRDGVHYAPQHRRRRGARAGGAHGVSRQHRAVDRRVRRRRRRARAALFGARSGSALQTRPAADEKDDCGRAVPRAAGAGARHRAQVGETATSRAHRRRRLVSARLGARVQVHAGRSARATRSSACARVAAAPSPISGVASLVELSHLLYSCDQEERHLSGGRRGAYMVPRHGSLVRTAASRACAAFSIVAAPRAAIRVTRCLPTCATAIG
jgi:hypothetical protein